MSNGATDAVIAHHWSDGGEGAVELANALVKACTATTSKFHYLYDLNSSIEDKILKIAKEMYGAGAIELHQNVKEKIKLYYAQVKLLIFINIFGLHLISFLLFRASRIYQFAWRKLRIL